MKPTENIAEAVKKANWIVKQVQLVNMDGRNRLASNEGALLIAEALLACVSILKTSREQFALMAEGEGPDPEIYMEMSRSSFKLIDQFLSGIKPEDSGEGSGER